MDLKLLRKYDVPVPRYTSYPAVPHWDTTRATVNSWREEIRDFGTRDTALSLYVHLPYCEALCTYCGCTRHITKNHSVEAPYIRAVLKEWEIYKQWLEKKPLIREIHLGGGTPTFFAPHHLKQIIEGLLQGAGLDSSYSLSLEAHPGSTSPTHLEVLRETGFNRISIGVQDFDGEVMRKIHRFQTPEEVARVTGYAQRLGYSVNFDLIYGLPLQTPDHIRRNMDQVARLKPDRIAFYSYAHIPEVKNAQRAYSEKDLPSGWNKLKLYRQGKEALEALGYHEIGMDHFALTTDPLYRALRNQKLHRNFMGYTPHATDLCIGLGMSAISSSPRAYAQNVKSVQGYINKVSSAQESAVFKTHFLTKEDQRVRRQIQDLICHYQTHWFDCKKHFTPALQQAFRTLEQDGLVKVFPYQVKVTRKGKSFIRNICRVLDARMDQGDRQRTFSRAV